MSVVEQNSAASNGSKVSSNTVVLHALPTAIDSNAEARRERCVKALRSRARTYSLTAAIDMGTIIVVLIFMASSFAVADRMTRLEEQVAEERALIADLGARSDEVATATTKIVTATAEFRDGIEQIELDPKNPEPGVVKLQESIDKYLGQMRDAHPASLDARPALVVSQESDGRFLVQTVSVWIARFGILACGIFLIQILVSRYKFNARLSGQYDAMADALDLVSNFTMLGFDQLLAALTPKLDFGPAPKPMTQDLASLVAQVAGAAKKE
jgi:hypothetical protein